MAIRSTTQIDSTGSMRKFTSVSDSEKINGLSKSDTSAWSNVSDATDWWYQIKEKKWSAQNDTLMPYIDSLKAGYNLANGAFLTDFTGDYDLTNNGTATNTNDGKNGYCVTLNGSSQSLSVSVEDKNLNVGSGAWAQSIWAFTASPGTIMVLWSVYDGANDAQFLRIDGSGANLKYYINESGTPQGFDQAYSFPTSTWTHVVAAGLNGTVYLYAQGALLGSQAMDAPLAGTTMYYGVRGGGGTQYWSGRLDEPYRFIDPPFTDAASITTFVSALYNGGTGAFLV